MSYLSPEDDAWRQQDQSIYVIVTYEAHGSFVATCHAACLSARCLSVPRQRLERVIDRALRGCVVRTTFQRVFEI